MKEKIFILEKYKTSVRFMDKKRSMAFPESGRLLFVFDENTFPIFSPYFDAIDTPNFLVLPPGEENKNWNAIDKILTAAMNAGLGRDAVFVGIGGGVVCDITAFAASIYMRGCGLILIPTTLLSMIDASLGGKTGIDFKGYKNIAGTFYPAGEIRICIESLSTLPDSHFKGGLSEVIKHGMLGSRSLFRILTEEHEKILSRDPGCLEKIILKSIEIKGKYVRKDLLENGIRAHLNLGHTFAHALESVSGFSGWSHGEAVAWGLNMAIKTGLELGITSSRYGERVEKLLNLYAYRLFAEKISPADILEAMKQDKKKRKGEVFFILQKDICNTLRRKVDDRILLKILKKNLS